MEHLIEWCESLPDGGKIALGFIFIIICCLIIWRASDGFEDASGYLGRNLSDGVRGATINAIGSSMPELFTTFFFFYYFAFVMNDPERASDGFSGGIGTTAGSALFNGMIIPAVVIIAVIFAGLAKRVNVSQKVLLRDGLCLIAVELCLIVLLSGTTLFWWHGLILMGLYGLYVIIMFSTMSAKEDADEEDDEEDYYQNEDEGSFLKNLLTLNLSPLIVKKNINTGNAWALLILAMLIIGAACFLLVFSCEELIGKGFHISTYFVAVILASAATSVPDTIISYRDAMDGEYDDAVANALGSNIFDVCFALGLPLAIFAWINGGSIEMSPGVVDDVTELRVILVVLTVIAFFVYIVGKGMGRLKAFLLIALYIFFVFFIVGKVQEWQWALDLGTFFRSWVT